MTARLHVPPGGRAHHVRPFRDARRCAVSASPGCLLRHHTSRHALHAARPAHLSNTVNACSLLNISAKDTTGTAGATPVPAMGLEGEWAPERGPANWRGLRSPATEELRPTSIAIELSIFNGFSMKSLLCPACFSRLTGRGGLALRAVLSLSNAPAPRSPHAFVPCRSRRRSSMVNFDHCT